MNEYLIQESTLNDIAEKIQAKSGYNNIMTASEFADKIDSIKTPTDGSILTKTSEDLIVNKTSIVIPSGYYDSDMFQITADYVTRAIPSISINSSGTITANVTQNEGYVEYGTESASIKLPTQAETTIIPSTSPQTAVASGVYTTGDVVVDAVPTQTKGATPSSSVQYITPDSGKFLSEVAVYAVPIQTKDVTPTSSNQTITPDSGKFLSSVIVNGDSNLIPSNIKSGVTIFGVSGNCTSINKNYLSKVVITNQGDALMLCFNDSIGDIVSGSISFCGNDEKWYTVLFDNVTISTILQSSAGIKIIENGISWVGFDIMKVENRYIYIFNTSQQIKAIASLDVNGFICC